MKRLSDLVALKMVEAVIVGLPWLKKSNPMVNWGSDQLHLKGGDEKIRASRKDK